MTKEMNLLLKLEEAALFLFSILLFSQLDYAWWMYPACLLLPDVSMLGYLINSKVGAWTYNTAHHKAIAVAAIVAGIFLHIPMLHFAGIILLGHSSMDRMLGYGLKYSDSFSHTHLGKIGK